MTELKGIPGAEWHDPRVLPPAADHLPTREALRRECDALRKRYEILKLRLDIANENIEQDREARRAALNLLEDAVQAREAEQHENAERRRVERELREAGRRKDEFLAMLAHELRNPLAPIRNSIQILRLAGANNDSAERVYEMLERQVNHMVRLVDDLMEVSRITRGKIELRKERVEIAMVVRTAVEASKPLIDSCRHQLAITLPAEPLTLEADPVRMAQVVTNLLNNAAKYTRAEGQIWLNVQREGNKVLISVKDNGIGIAPENLSKSFELFAQLDRSLARSEGGLGIGLTLVRSMVEAHGGSVKARSDGLNRGAEFVVSLPLALPDFRQQSRADEPERPIIDPAHRILIVDDNRDAADSLGMLLKCLGANVRTVHNGAGCLRALTDYSPTVIILDIGMPGMDGNETARRVRARQQGREVTLVALTGWGQEDDRLRSYQAGFDFHLIKPVDSDELQHILADIPVPAQSPPIERN